MPAARFRIRYQRYGELREDMTQMTRGGLLVKVPDAAGLELGSAVALELVLPDGVLLAAEVEVLHMFPGVGVAVSITPAFLDQVRRKATGKDAGAAAARHERVDQVAAPATPAVEPEPAAARGRGSTAVPATDTLSNAEKIQLALHGNRDQRNAILRDTNRTLHPFVLKNPQINAEDVLAMAKSAMTSAELLRLIAERKEWLQRPQIALALARNTKTPPDVAVRALDHAPMDALRQMAKGSGAPPHVIQAARKKVLK